MHNKTKRYNNMYLWLYQQKLLKYVLTKVDKGVTLYAVKKGG